MTRLSRWAAVFAGCWLAGAAARAATPADAVDLRHRLLAISSQLLDEAQVSYVYGGATLGSEAACQACNVCLETKQPAPSQRFRLCPKCASCSLDCSHFTNLVYAEAGMGYPYIETASMRRLSAAQLLKRFGLVDLGTDLSQAKPGDLLVYNGHVVMLERLDEPAEGEASRYRGDIVHATGGKDIRAPGEGIQRERFIDLATFRGPLKRILRHVALASRDGLVPAASAPRSVAAPVSARAAPPPATARATLRSPPASAPALQTPPAGLRRLRPVEKRGEAAGEG